MLLTVIPKGESSTDRLRCRAATAGRTVLGRMCGISHCGSRAEPDGIFMIRPQLRAFMSGITSRASHQEESSSCLNSAAYSVGGVSEK